MVLKVTVEVGLSFGLVAGAKSSGGCHIETDVPEAAGPQYCRDVLLQHVLFQSMRQRGIRLQGDFVEDGLLVRHGSSRSPVRLITSRCRFPAYASTLPGSFQSGGGSP